MDKAKEYFVFISYSSLDNEWAIWLRYELDHYHLPASNVLPTKEQPDWPSAIGAEEALRKHVLKI